MKIYDETLENELVDPDLNAGKLEPAQRLVAHHDPVEEVWHYEVMKSTITEECPEGLRIAITDTPASDAWDEYETVQKYVLFTAEELAEKAAEEKAKADAEKARQEAAKKAQAEAQAKAQAEKEQAEKIARIDSIDAQATYTAMMTDTLMEEN